MKASCTPAFLDQVWQFLPLLQTSGLKIVVVFRAFSLGRCNKPQDEQELWRNLVPYLILTNACVTLPAASFHWPALVESLRTVEGKNTDLSSSCRKPQTEPMPLFCFKTTNKYGFIEECNYFLQEFVSFSKFLPSIKVVMIPSLPQAFPRAPDNEPPNSLNIQRWSNSSASHSLS